MHFAAIDFETATSLRSSACAIGVTVVRDGVLVSEQSWLIRPPANEYSGWNIGIHGISPSHTATAPHFGEVWAEVAPLVAGLPIVAHNAPFDIGVLRAGLDMHDEAYPEVPVWCTVVTSRRAFPGRDRYGLGVLCADLGLQLDRHHDASADAAACARLLLHCAHEHGCADLDALAAVLEITPGRIFERDHERCTGPAKPRRRARATLAEPIQA